MPVYSEVSPTAFIEAYFQMGMRRIAVLLELKAFAFTVLTVPFAIPT